jgi:4'-phosphopantetheinyl transferase EntD
MRLIRELLPPEIRVAETESNFGTLLPSEEDYFRGASSKRILEATTVRACARRLLANEGIHDHPFVPSTDGRSPWPDTVVGSMTHTRGYRAVALGYRRRYLAIGIDAERAIPLSQAVLEAVQHPADVSTVTHPLWTAILFSAKEATFKACSSAGFDVRHPLDISIRLGSSGSFEATLPSVPSVSGQLSGRWGISHAHVMTAVVVMRTSPHYAPPRERSSSLMPDHAALESIDAMTVGLLE